MVFQKNHALGGTLASKLGMGFQVGMIGIFVVSEVRSLHYQLEHLAYTRVDRGDVQVTLVDMPYDVSLLPVVARSQQVIARSHSVVRGAMLVGPVGHHYALIAPLVAQDGGEQVVT